MRVRYIRLRLDEFLLLLILLPVAVVGGCKDECEVGKTRCVDGTILEICTEYETSEMYFPPHWLSVECSDKDWNIAFCVVAPNGEAYCAAEEEPRWDLCGVPEEPAGTLKWTCDGASRLIGCVDGVVAFSRTCVAGRCVVPGDGGQVFCSILPDKDPLCGAGTYSNCADETTRIRCREGYRVEQDHCSGAGGCRAAALEEPRGTTVYGMCVLAPQKDSRCEEAEASGRVGFCDDLTAITCYLGYPIISANCMSECSDQELRPECIGGPTGEEEGWERGDPPDCSDGFDNDYDGLVDYPDDPSCLSPSFGSG